MKHNEYEFFKEATLKICSSLDSNIALGRLLTFLKKQMPVDGVYLMVGKGDTLSLEVLANAPENRIRPVRPIPVDPALIEFLNDIADDIADKGRGNTIHIINDPDVELDQHSLDVVRTLYRRPYSFITLPLIKEKEKLGIFIISTRGKFRYQDHHGHLISLLHDPLSISMKNVLMHQEVLRLKNVVEDDNRYLRKQIRNFSESKIIGENKGLKCVIEAVSQVASLGSPVLLLGETGVGKDVIANAIHCASPRKNKPFIPINCGALAESIVESELFGHEKGAFTSAVSLKRGLFERANGGTIFLDEISEMPLPMQVKLLRILHNKEIERVGGNKMIPIDVRVISASNQNLVELVKKGKFREDLWFRLNVFPIVIPALRHRKEDIPYLVRHFIHKKCDELKIHPKPSVKLEEIKKLEAYAWPGNVRELENIVERALIQGKTQSLNGFLNLGGLLIEPAEQKQALANTPMIELDELISLHLQQALKTCRGRVEGYHGAAKLLGVNPNTLRSKMRKLRIPFGKVSHD